MSGQELVLRHAMDVDNGFGRPGDSSIRIDWRLVPRRDGHTIIMRVNPDRKEQYEKQANGND